MKKLPVDVHDFEALITGDHVYVDKTQYIHKMATEGTYYFLSRPRRFGKTLLVSTLEHLFKGDKELFAGLWIENSDWDWTPHPVLKIDFSEISAYSPEVLRKSVIEKLHRLGESTGVEVKSELLRNCFSDLIIDVYEKHQRRIAILIDEYDQPLISHLGKGEVELEIAQKNRDVLREFYGVLKGGNVGKALRFVFLTGISKFARVSIFSELNNLDDLSMQDPYSALLGYTDEELWRYFEPYIRQLSKRLKAPVEETLHDIRTWYNGYRFSDLEVKVYNPFSVAKLLKQGKFQNYWFDTATPAFLVNLIKEKKYPIPDIENLQLTETSFSTYDLDRLDLEPLLFQTGYITIRGFDGVRYRLSYPNQEVKNAFLSYLYKSLVEIPRTTIKEQYTLLHEFLAQEKLEQFIETANAILAAIPYEHIGGQDEHYYHTVFYLMLSASGVLVLTEPLTSIGRIDMEVHFPDKVYIVELKCNQSAEQAIAQIKAKKYFEKHLHGGRKILLLGINFSTEERRITEWRVEEVMES
ncbi:ATP-binding protein [candidate division KSB1 bacterium]|nr:ATP-binding protein [candidate division KSB1 bacterium]